jgi:HPt (histidine-containing phosphotransfer) domain-containing protein
VKRVDADALYALHAEYRRDLPNKVQSISALWTARRISELHRALHTIAGSAGTFGLPELSAAAREAEHYLAACGPTLDAGQQAGFQRLLEAICSRAASAR